MFKRAACLHAADSGEPGPCWESALVCLGVLFSLSRPTNYTRQFVTCARVLPPPHTSLQTRKLQRAGLTMPFPADTGATCFPPPLAFLNSLRFSLIYFRSTLSPTVQLSPLGAHVHVDTLTWVTLSHSCMLAGLLSAHLLFLPSDFPARLNTGVFLFSLMFLFCYWRTECRER